ncbi:hypothetical protein DICTH_1823 [Dictyoglomus thermophilum H-6-12]|uniref:Uncharacterized protein n=1 Tax=Dictyoglomus thermophilum (strain ATCC 35947 / DSM 3960 / H-6-12) TaxID=309799 RepID=B5YBA6_DICT6|nr:hypothetical protein DICTH_1823 [Dictyoglomus thermophilum H-6-12]
MRFWKKKFRISFGGESLLINLQGIKKEYISTVRLYES